jgi:molybdate transport system substrate-binding protein
MSTPGAIQVLSGGAMRRPFAEIVPLFDAAAGTKVDIAYRLTSLLRKDIETGAMFDVVVLPRPEIDALTRSGKIAAGTTTDIARSAVGLAVRAGAPKPDIATVESLRRRLLAAHSIAYSDGPSGLYIAGLMQRLGIAEEMKPKTKLVANGGPVAQLVALGEAELGMQQIVEILPVEGAALAGRLPGELQNIITYAAGFSPQAADNSAAQAFVAFMATPQAHAVLLAKGMEPPSAER